MRDPTPPSPRRLLRAEQVLSARSRRICLVLEGSQDPHNVHAVMRTAEALGIQDLHLVAPRGEAGAIAAGVTLRAHEWLSVRRHPDIDACAELLRSENRRIYATANEPEAQSVSGFAPEGRIALLFGNESEGLSPRARELADGLLRIDLVGFSSSLNLSVSAAILLWELRRQELPTASAGDLSSAERLELREGWYRKLLGRRVQGAEALQDWIARGEGIAARSQARDRVSAGERQDS